MAFLSNKIGSIMLYRKTSFLYGLICGSCLAAILGCGIFGITIYKGFVIAALIFAIGTYLCAISAEKTTRELRNILFTDMNPDLFLKEFMAKVFSKDAKNWGLLETLLVSKAYETMGKFNSAEYMYIDFLNRRKQDVQAQIVVISKLVILYSDIGNAVAALKANSRLTSVTEGVQLPENIANYVTVARYCSLACAGEAEKCIEYFKQECNSEGYSLSKVNMHYRLARLYEQCGQTENALHEYRIAEKDGKQTYAAIKARERLTDE